MKTTIFTVIALLGLSVVTTKTTQAATVKNDVSTVLTDVKNINKIEVRGNVQLYVSDGAYDNVKVYNNYYSESALVQNQNGVLRISSYTKDKLVVWVTAADLRSIKAYDNAEVKSFGNLSGIDLNVELNNNAMASLNIDAYNANITVNDNAKADLKGNATQCALTYNQSATVNSSKFETGKMVRTVNNTYNRKNTEQLAGL
ncbi:GIN domain-containing protein [Mucilaginibacter sp. KACC 22063]|uniref:GIN domain-containing protein n=1 Tax=Mucilaginibacter sp. KACC 22063 TaxID=3025666 RepID=UPI00236515E4|nr:DUF2807 domain-containing protein [Mucilaginibacter sp. KACC 22063]WDF54067.1 DUF2807 domain-containing protein [Mucilaginibacter sp. KACC 22063]